MIADFSLDGRIHQMDTSGNVINTFQSPGSGPEGLAFDGKYLWTHRARQKETWP